MRIALNILLILCLAFGGGFAATKEAAATTQSWRYIGPGPYGALWALAIAPGNPRTILVGLDMGIALLTHDGGKSWNPVGSMAGKPAGNPAFRGAWGAAIDPVTPNRMWIAGEHGAWKSEDGGRTWRFEFGGPPNPVYPIAIDPVDHNVVYIAEGRSVRTGVSWGTGYVRKTVDGGKTWTVSRPGGPLAADNVRARNWSHIVIDPSSPILPGQGHARIFIAGQGGFYRSDDAGATWTSLEDKIPGGIVDLARINEYGNPAVHTSGICDLTLIPHSPHPILFATFQVVPTYKLSGRTWRGGVYRSDDGGETWTEKNKGLEPLLAYMSTDDYHAKQGLAFAFSMIRAAPSDPNVLYFGCHGAVFRSDDQGESWVKVTNPNDQWRKIPTPDGSTMYAHVRLTGGNYVKASWGSIAAFNGLEVAPDNANIVAYTDNNGIGLSVDGGKTWDEPLFDYGAAYKTGPGPGGSFAGTAPTRLTNLVRNRGATIVVPNAIAIDPFDAKTIAVGYDDVGIEISRDSGNWWAWGWDGIYPNSEQNNCLAIAYDPTVKDRLYAACGRTPTSKLYRSDDNGATFTRLLIMLNGVATTATINDILIDPSSPASSRHLIVATEQGLRSSVDGGETWIDLTSGLPPKAPFWRIVQDPIDPRRLYVGTDPYTHSQGAGLYRSVDGGANWTHLAVATIGAIRTLSICAAHPDTLVVSAQQPGDFGTWAHPKLYRSDDGGNTWTVLDNRRCAAAAVDPVDPNILFEATWAMDITKESVGIWRSADGGKTWTEFIDKPPFTVGFTKNDRFTFDPKDPAHIFVLTSTGVIEGHVGR